MPPPHLPHVGRNLVNQRKDKTVVSNNGSLPSDIKCFVCKKSKPRAQYANRQLQRYTSTIHNPYAPAGRTLTDPKTTCRTCTPQQTTELTCCICTKTKGLTSFAKNQRKNPDTARCIKCVQFHLDTEPDYEVPNSDEYSESDSDEDDFDEPEKGKPKVQLPKVRRGPGFGDIQNESTPTGASGNQSGTSYANPEGGVPSGVSIDFDDGRWESVTSAGARPSARQHILPSRPGTTTAPSNHDQSVGSGSVRKNGWAKVEKVAKGQETKWGAATQESDIWDDYARQLGNRRDASKRTSNKKKPRNIESDDDDDGY